ncbi:MAG: sigma-54-dependent Fis family transcriptional regulator, partial [Nitrospirae bacterium]|nr:sigma-54-dependent Fis family transcriptional regulator [Nitrospirota bacterium]
MDNSLIKILVVDDDPDILDLITDRLSAKGFSVIKASNGADALNAIRREDPTIVFLDLQMPKVSGLDVLRTIKMEGLNATVVVISAFGTLENAVEAMKEGAYDFIVKPFDPAHIEVVINKVLEREGLKRDREYLSLELGERYRFVTGSDTKMTEIIEMAKRVADSKATVLLSGESGTGKEVIARAIHQWSSRANGPFIPINCVALSEGLLESELFGHEKGAFTGAIAQKKGKLELADGGTLFLDEIGDITPSLQAKLLRVLQDHEFERVGGTKFIRVDIRVIAATNRDLQKAISEGKFREDLFYRLNVVNLKMPPLRERIDDLPVLAEYFMNRFSKEMKKEVRKLSEEAMNILIRYH